MAGGLGLAAYLALHRRSGGAPPPPAPPRPAGALVWAHGIDAPRAEALADLAQRMAQERPELSMLLTTPDPHPATLRAGGPVIVQPMPGDNLHAAEAFFAHWRPDLGLWTAGDMAPTLLHAAQKAQLQLFLIDADAAHLERTGSRLLPDPRRALLQNFRHILARSADAVRTLRRLGVERARIDLTGPFRGSALTLPCRTEERDDLAASLRGRPIWLAAMLRPDEIEIALAAHRDLALVAHRALMVLVPDDSDDTPAIRDKLTAGGWRYVTWSEGEMPEETTQIILADTRGEMGLWYRLAPVTFMGSSLTEDGSGHDPDEPAAHGSAILYGPAVARYQARYDRYAAAGAARMVGDRAMLVAALRRLIAPDEAATMAHAAWDIVSEGAHVTDRITELVFEALDAGAAMRHASADPEIR